MGKVKLSISIPYKQRIDNLKIVFQALANQTMAKSEFEVIVGAMEYSEEFITLCKKFNNDINIISVLSDKDFSIPRARNLATRQASGEILIQMDADTLLPTNALQNLYDKHFAFSQKICIVGQVIGYGNNNDGDVKNVEILPYSEYQKALVDLEKYYDNPQDPRFQVTHVIPWAFGWTGLIAIPLDIIKAHSLYFDESFHGWGVDDLEWSYRICRTGTPIILCKDISAIHLPHIRDQSANSDSEKQNYLRFIKKWPYIDVELAYAFGDVKANDLFLEYNQEINNAVTIKGNRLTVVHCRINTQEILLVGVEVNNQGNIINAKIRDFFNINAEKTIFSLIGMALPYNNKQISKCYVFPTIKKFPNLYMDKVQQEVNRVSKETVIVDKKVSCLEGII